MAYVNMLSNNEQYSSFAHPRISFSNDFADTQQHQAASTRSHHEQVKYKEAPVSSDFEFSVENYAMIPADEIFFKGVLLPLKDERKLATLGEELRSSLDDDDEDDCVISKASNWWKLGLKSKKDPKKNEAFRDAQGINTADKSQNCLASILEHDD